MSDSNDSVEEVSPHNGDHVSNGVEEKDESNGPINHEDSIVQEKEAELEKETETETESGDIHHLESKEDMFVDAPDDMQDTQFQEMDNGSIEEDSSIAEKDTVTEDYNDEREKFAVEVGNLRLQLRDLASKKSSILPIDENEVKEETAGGASLSEMISECSHLVKLYLEEKLQTESTINELRQQIEDLNGKIQVEQNIEVVADRMLQYLSLLVNQEELLDYSVLGKISHVEKNTFLLGEQYRWFLYEVDQLRQCLLDGGFNVGEQEEFGYAAVFSVARGELLELKRREVEMLENVNRLEDMNRKFIEEVEQEKAKVEMVSSELDKVKLELEQEKNRCANTKEKLSMAVTKGKALVQQRDSLKQSLAEKASELEKCLQEKSSAAEAAELFKVELAKCESLVASLQEMLTERNAMLESFEQVFSQTIVPEELQSVDVTERLKWLVNIVASLQETLSQKNVILENFEAIFSQTSVFGEIESMDMIEKLKWIVNLVASLQEMLSQKNGILNSLEILSKTSAPVEVQSMDLVERFKWIVEERSALKDNLLEFHQLKDALSLIDLPETALSCDLETRIGWLKDSLNQAKGEINMLQVEIARTKEVAQSEIARIKEAAQSEIDSLSATLLVESQEKEYIKLQLDDLACKFEEANKEAYQASYEKDQMVKLLLESSGVTETYSDVATLIERCFGKVKEQSTNSFDTSAAHVEVFERMQNLLYVRDQELMLCEKLLEEDVLARAEVKNLSDELRTTSLELATLKEEKDSLQKELERSEDKSALLREKLSLAVKKGKGLVQDRENLKLTLDEKKTEIEKLKLDLQQQESTIADCRDEINRLSTDVEQLPVLEADLMAMRNKRDELEQFLLESNSMLQKVIESIDHIVLPLDSVFEDPVEKVIWLKGYMAECQQAKSHAEEELDKVKEETSFLNNKLAEAQQIKNSLEDALSNAEKQVSQLTEEKMEIQSAKEDIEQELQKVRDELNVQTQKITEACATIKSLEDALSLAEKNISVFTKEREEAQLSRAATETELDRVREEVAIQTSKLMEAYGSVKSLEDALFQAEANVSLLAEQNNHLQVGRTDLEYEITKLKKEAESQASRLVDASSTMRSLEDALSKAGNDISVLEGEKRISEQEISTLNSKLKACMDELAGTNGNLENRSAEFIHLLSDMEMLIRNESLLPLVRQHFEWEFENLKNMDLVLRNIKGHFVNASSEVMPTPPIMEENWHVIKPFPHDLGDIMKVDNDNDNAADVGNISNYFKKIVERLQSQNTILVDHFECFSASIHEFIEALFTKLRATEDAVTIMFEHMKFMEQNMKNMELHKEEQEKTVAMLENDCRVLLFACTNATSKLKFEEPCLIPELEKLNYSMNLEPMEVDADDMVHQQSIDGSRYKEMAENLLLATRRVQAMTTVFESTSKVAAVTIEDLQKKLLDSRADFEKAIEERDLIRNRVSELENNVENLRSSCEELRLKTSDYDVIGERLKEKEAELSNLHNNLLMKEVFESTSKVAAATIEDLQKKLLESRADLEKAIEERDLIQNRVSELENNIENLQISCEELRLKTSDYDAIGERLKEKEAELSNLHNNLLMKEQENECALISASELKTLFDKIREVENPLVQSEAWDMKPRSSVDVHKLFSIIDSIPELHHQINILSHDKDELQSTLSMQVDEIEHLKEEIEKKISNNQDSEKIKNEMFEISSSLEKIIDILGGSEIVGDPISTGVQSLLPVVEKQVMALLLEARNSKSQVQELSTRLLGSQKDIEDLSTKIKFLEDSLQNKTSQPEIVKERSIFEGPSLPTGSEISEIDDTASVGKNGVPLPPAAQLRTMRKGSTDHLVLSIDSESTSLINNEETDEEKGHVFKSLNTSGLIPKQGKSLADRVDGIWVSGGRVLMSRPRARLGLIAYWLVLHLWLLGTIL